MLAALYLHPEREQTATALARESGVSLPTILRDIDRLTTAGFVLERTSGRNRYLKVNQSHPIFGAVSEVLRYTYGPLALLPEILAAIPGIEEAHLFGSWAARYLGELGGDPNDVDVVAIGNPDRMRIFEAASVATTGIGREVNIRAISRADWEDAQDLFVRTVKGGPLVEVPLGGGAE